MLLGRSRSLPMPPLTVDLIADNTAARAGSVALCRSIAARNSSSDRSEVTPRSAMVALYASLMRLYQGSRKGPDSVRIHASSGRTCAGRR